MTVGRCVYVVGSAAPPVLGLVEPITWLQARGWTVAVILTPAAGAWVDADGIGSDTGCLVRSTAWPLTEEDPLPRADAVLTAPLTFNSLNKWAAGFADTLAVAILCELLGVNVPIVVAPCVKDVLRRHPAYGESIERLVDADVRFIDPDAVTYRASSGLAAFDWRTVLHEFDQGVRRTAL